MPHEKEITNLSSGMTQVQKDTKVMDISRVFRSEFVVWQYIYNEIEKGYLWLAGKQYTKAQLHWYESQRRPTNVFNLIFPHINTLMGEFLESHKEDRVFPIGKADPLIAEKLQDMLVGIRQDNDDEDTMTEMLLAGLIKVGWVYSRYSNEDNPEGAILTSAIDEFEMLYDSRCKNYYTDDAAYQQRHRWLTVDNILNHPRFRQHRRAIEKSLMDRKESNYWEGMDEDTLMMINNVDLADEHNGKYRIIEHHEKRWEMTEVAYNPITRDSYIWDIGEDGEKADLFFKHNPDFVIRERHDQVKYITTILPGINFLLDERKANLQDRMYDYTPFSAYHYGMRTIDNFGIFKNAFGPQAEFNDWHNRTADMVNKMSNPGTISKPAYIENNREIDNFGSMTGLNVRLKASATGPVKDYFSHREMPQFHAGMDKMQREAMEMLPKILGITPNQMGFSESKQEPAELFARRVQQASKALGVIYKNISKTKKRKGDKELANFQRFYTTQRTIHFFNKQTSSPEDFEINSRVGSHITNDITVGRFQVYINDENRNPAMREVRFQQKLKIAFEYIAQLYGPTAIDPNWLFEDASLGDMREQIERINGAIEQLGISGSETEAMNAANAFLDMANKRGGDSSDKPKPKPQQQKAVGSPA